MLISENLGEVAASSYRKFYNDKPDKLVIESISELLTEVLGENKAREKINILEV